MFGREWRSRELLIGGDFAHNETRHDVLHVMTRRGDPHAPREGRQVVDTRVPPTLAVDLRQRKLRPSGAATAPLTNDSWPPAPEYCRPPIASTATWPARSIDSAPLTLAPRAPPGSPPVDRRRSRRAANRAV